MGLWLVVLVWLMAGAALFCAWSCARKWRIGRAAPVDWTQGLLALPRRYLVDVHDVVARRPAAARMHALVAGGLLGATALLMLGVLPALRAQPVYWDGVGLLFGVGLIGALLDARRRIPQRPDHLSGGAFLWLPLWLGLYLGGGLVVALFRNFHGLSVVGLAAAAIGGGGLVEMLRRGPMRHAIAGVVTLASHPRPARFGGGRDVALRSIDLDAPQLGCGTPADFAWNRLASFDACIQCGRCEQVCPAFAAGQRLNPKKLIRDLAAAMQPEAAIAYAGSPAPHAPPTAGRAGPQQPIIGIGAMIHPDTLWACTTCRACVEECPMMIEHVDAVIDLRRHQTLMLGLAPRGTHASLRASRYAAEPGAHDLSARTDFAAGLDLPVLAEGGETDILLWLGDGAYDLRYGRTLRALVRLLDAAGQRFAVLGEAEPDTGDLARRLGDEATFQSLAKEVVATLSARRFTRIVTADPHALNILRNEYPALGGHWTVTHHTALLDELVTAGRLPLRQRDAGVIAYHDPCYLSRYNGEIEAPRRLLDAACAGRVEMQRHGMRGMCCGGGGGNPVSDVDAQTRIPDLRMAMAVEVGAVAVAVACPGCTAMLEGVAGARPQVRDVAEFVLDALVLS